MALPVVVFSGDLFTVPFDEAGEIDAERADHVQVAWREPLSASSLSLVDVVTEAALPGFCADLFQTAETLCVGHVSRRGRRKRTRAPAFRFSTALSSATLHGDWRVVDSEVPRLPPTRNQALAAA